jgi:hypothetical protein
LASHDDQNPSSGAAAPYERSGAPTNHAEEKIDHTRVWPQMRKSGATTPARKLFSATWCARAALYRDHLLVKILSNISVAPRGSFDK